MQRNDIYNFIRDSGIETPNDSIDIEAILENHNMNSVLARDLLKDLSEEMVDSMKSIYLPRDVMAEYCSKLVEYRFIDQIFQLQKGKHIRWLRKDSIKPKLTNGGIVMDIKFTNKGVSILCKSRDRFLQYNFDDCLTYQKLSPDELMVIGCMKLADS